MAQWWWRRWNSRAHIETLAKSASMINVPFHRIAILTGKYLFATVRTLSALSSRLQQTFCSRSETPTRERDHKINSKIKVFANFGHKTRSQTIKTRASAIFPQRDLFAGRDKNNRRQKPLTVKECALGRRVQLMRSDKKRAWRHGRRERSALIHQFKSRFASLGWMPPALNVFACEWERGYTFWIRASCARRLEKRCCACGWARGLLF